MRARYPDRVDRRQTQLRPLALAYHGLAEVSRGAVGRGLFVRPVDFERQVRALRRWGYTLVAAGEQAKLARQSQAAGTASVSFDDGLADNVSTLLPLLVRERIPATVFVVTGWLGHHHPAASWTPIITASGLRKLYAAGIEIGGHTVTHRDLTTVSVPDAMAELLNSRMALEALLGAPVTVAAYPFGHANIAVERACRAAGYEAAFRSAGRGSWSNQWALPRHDMNYDAGVLGLRLKRAGVYEPVMQYVPARASRKVIRGVRRFVRFASGGKL
jgi:peptidoglycan/xylan/chitin deacetylase (PgdA/CDA1 family)